MSDDCDGPGGRGCSRYLHNNIYTNIYTTIQYQTEYLHNIEHMDGGRGIIISTYYSTPRIQLQGNKKHIKA